MYSNHNHNVPTIPDYTEPLNDVFFLYLFHQMLSAYQGHNCLVLGLGTYILMMSCVMGMRKISQSVVIEELVLITVDILRTLVCCVNVSTLISLT